MMSTNVNINPDILTWSINRAGYNLEEIALKIPNVKKWIEGEKYPTVRQLEAFSKKVHLPFGYFLRPEPPVLELPIPYYRSNQDSTSQVSTNTYDTIILLQQRQDWLREYLIDLGLDILPFVGKYKNLTNVNTIVSDIRNTLGLEETWANQFTNWEEALNHLTSRIEDIGIIITYNSIVGNNTHRSISVEECRGFVLVDDIAPLMFVNNADYKTAKMFTIVHEIAHIWTGKSAGFDFRRLQPANDPNEILCDKIAAEFLVPKNTFNEIWRNDLGIKNTSRYFKVSEIVIARRALDTNKITRDEFFDFYEEYSKRERPKKKSSGGNFYGTIKKRLGKAYAIHIHNAVKSGKLLYRDAYKLTGLKGNTFQTFFEEKL